MEWNYRIYNIKKAGWTFNIEARDNGKFIAAIPDCGGMADMVPKIPAQQAWCEKKFSGIKNVKQIWSTVWEVEDAGAFALIEKALIGSGAVLESSF